MNKSLLGLCALLLILTACAPVEPPGDAGAEQALRDYFTFLNTGQYAEADELFAGSYETLAGWNPDVDPDDHALLWQRGCTQNGLLCLAPERIALDQVRGGVYFFKVIFTAPEGGTFVLGPCCGATEEEMPSTSVFDYNVIYVNGHYKVVNLPVYTP